METTSSADLIAKLEAPFWFSGTTYMQRDIHFILKLLSAPIYKDVPNLYERLVMYQTTMETLANRLSRFQDEIAEFKKNLENYDEEKGPAIDEYYYGRWKRFENDFIALDSDFLTIKYEILGYLETVILTSKKRHHGN